MSRPFTYADLKGDTPYIPDLFAQPAEPPPSKERLWREELPARVWQVTALMAGTRQPRDETEVLFRAYHQDNPHVYDLFDRYTRMALGTGRRSYSAWNVINRLRWDIEMQAADHNAEFKIANEYIAFYARWWMERNPGYLDFYDTKFRKVEVDIIDRLGRPPEGRAEGMQRRRQTEAA
jgi:hypothetical protein